MGAEFTSMNTVGRLTRHLGRKYVKRIPSTFLIPKQIPPGFKKKKKKEKQTLKSEKRENEKSWIYFLYGKMEACWKQICLCLKW